MLLNILIGAILILVTTVIHTCGMMLSIHINRNPIMHLKLGPQRERLMKVGAIVLLMFNVSLLEVALWAGTYLALNAIQGLEKAFYFSMVTFTTLGYGDVLLDTHWRLLASFEAVNGIIMFGWTTAIVMAVVHRNYFVNEKSSS